MSLSSLRESVSRCERSLIMLLSSLKETMDCGMWFVGFSGVSVNCSGGGGGCGGEKMVSLLVKMSGSESGVSWSISGGGGGEGGEISRVSFSGDIFRCWSVLKLLDE
ncbi:hypothetical protein Hanom_Chr02g00165441 [Helianthus anomalus]